MADGGATAQIVRFDEITPIDRGNGIRSTPLVGEQTGSTVLLTGMTLFPPGAAIPLHTHNSDECIVLLEGRTICEVDGERHEMSPYDTAFIPAGLPHRFINVGDGPMRILWAYSSVHTTRTFVETGETIPHLGPLPRDPRR